MKDSAQIIKSLKRYIDSLVTENEQLKAKVKLDCAKSMCSVLPKNKLFSDKSTLQVKPDIESLRVTSVQSAVSVKCNDKLKDIPLKIESNNPWARKVS